MSRYRRAHVPGATYFSPSIRSTVGNRAMNPTFKPAA